MLCRKNEYGHEIPQSHSRPIRVTVRRTVQSTDSHMTAIKVKQPTPEAMFSLDESDMYCFRSS